MKDIRNFKMVVSIDPGTSGAICSMLYDTATNRCASVRSETMDKKVKGEKGNTRHIVKTVKEIHDYLSFLINETPNSGHLIFIEKIQMHTHKKDDPALMWKMRNLQTLQKNYNEIISIFQLRGFNYTEIAPRTWQKHFGIKEKERKDRKNAYKIIAHRKFPMIKTTLKNADALCILEYARVQALFEGDKLFK